MYVNVKSKEHFIMVKCMQCGENCIIKSKRETYQITVLQ